MRLVCCLLFIGLPVGATRANNEEDEEPDELRSPKRDNHDIVVVHCPQGEAIRIVSESAGRREKRGIALQSVWCEEHRAAGKKNRQLEQAGENVEVSLSDATEGGPAAPNTQEAVQQNECQAGNI